jgi:hypothetical protein
LTTVLSTINLSALIENPPPLKTFSTGDAPAGVRATVLFSLALSTAVIISATVGLIVVLARWSGARRFALVHYAIVALSAVAEVVAASHAASVDGDLPLRVWDVVAGFQALVYSAVWASYFAVSRRVANTFGAPNPA